MKNYRSVNNNFWSLCIYILIINIICILIITRWIISIKAERSFLVTKAEAEEGLSIFTFGTKRFALRLMVACKGWRWRISEKKGSLHFIRMIHRDPTRRQRLAYSKHKLQKVSIISVIVKYVLPNEKKKKESGPKRRSTSALRISCRRL